MMFMTDRLFKYELNDTSKTATLLEPIDGVSQFAAKHVKVAKMIGEYTITEIGPCAFCKSTTLETIEIPDSVTLIDDSAFSECGNLKKVHFYKTKTNHKVVDINKYAFANCFSLQSVTFEDSHKRVCIGSNAFAECVQLNIFDPLLLKLGANAFLNCSNLNIIAFTHSAKWYPSTFAGCSNLQDIMFFGDVDDSLPETCFNWLACKNIECPDSSKLVNLAYEGTNVKILPF